jgi:homoaconitase/3-isopropylmalate dehydratase large subunit
MTARTLFVIPSRGRQGRNARTHLMSPAMAMAAGSVAGRRAAAEPWLVSAI